MGESRWIATALVTISVPWVSRRFWPLSGILLVVVVKGASVRLALSNSSRRGAAKSTHLKIFDIIHLAMPKVFTLDRGDDGAPARPRSELERSSTQTTVRAALDFHIAVHGYEDTIEFMNLIFPPREESSSSSELEAPATEPVVVAQSTTEATTAKAATAASSSSAAAATTAKAATAAAPCARTMTSGPSWADLDDDDESDDES